MKGLGYFFIVLILLSFVSCSSYTPRDVEKRYTKLSNDLDYLMDDVISENKRTDLEREFINFTEGMEEYKKENTEENVDYLDEYLKKSRIKIQYLRDLRD